MRRSTAIVLPTLFALAVPAAALRAGDAAAPVAMAADQMKWVPNPDAPGVMTAVAWGDPAKGPHGALHKFVAGFTAPLHTHSSSNRIVVISGTMSCTGEDGKEMKFTAGSFYTQPNTYKHTTKCLPGSECLVYLEADARWDMKPVAGQ
jgi:anti-sigma factor ChrR (cupin superfamily)